MLTEEEYTSVVFTAMRANATLTETVRNKEALGCFPNWNLINCQQLKINSGLWTLSVADYNSEAGIDIYNQLLDIGSTWFGGIAVDPNAQDTIIEIINVLNAPQPVDPITFDMFDPATQIGDGRYIYYNSNWKGFNPILSLTSPMESALRLGTDYELIPTGGIELLATGNKPFIYDGETLRASSYQTIQTVIGNTGSTILNLFFVTGEIVAGLIDGSNTSYTLAHTPVVGTVQIFRNGIRQVVGTDYTILGASITYLYPPDIGDSLIADYIWES